MDNINDTIQGIRQVAEDVKNANQGENTSERVGGLFSDIGEVLQSLSVASNEAVTTINIEGNQFSRNGGTVTLPASYPASNVSISGRTITVGNSEVTVPNISYNGSSRTFTINGTAVTFPPNISYNANTNVLQIGNQSVPLSSDSGAELNLNGLVDVPQSWIDGILALYIPEGSTNSEMVYITRNEFQTAVVNSMTQKINQLFRDLCSALNQCNVPISYSGSPYYGATYGEFSASSSGSSSGSGTSGGSSSNIPVDSNGNALPKYSSGKYYCCLRGPMTADQFSYNNPLRNIVIRADTTPSNGQALSIYPCVSGSYIYTYESGRALVSNITYSSISGGNVKQAIIDAVSTSLGRSNIVWEGTDVLASDVTHYI